MIDLAEAIRRVVSTTAEQASVSSQADPHHVVAAIIVWGKLVER